MEYKTLESVYKWKEECYGCGSCAFVCPQNAIKMCADSEGFLYPNIDQNKCIGCMICVNQCIIGKEKFVDIKNVYASSAVEKEVIEKSTSGGIAYLLGREILMSGGVVYGAAYRRDNEVEHVRVERMECLGDIQGTKYVQSNIAEVYSQIQEDIIDEKEILFTGTPCQVAAIKCVFGYYRKLNLLEIVCMGCPSPGVWNSYIKDKEKEIGIIEKVKFRDKAIGWKGANISFYTENGKLSFRASMDEFLSGFGQCLFLRPSCHRCGYKGKKTAGDIKVGDFWGIENGGIPYNSKGTSVVIIENEKGNALLKRISDSVELRKVEYLFALSSNPCIEISKAPSKLRYSFFEEYNKAPDNVCNLIKQNLFKTFTEDDRYICQYPVVEGLLRLVVNNEVKQFFERNKYCEIALYGMSELGRLFADILLKNGIKPVCIVDKNYGRFTSYKDIPVIGPNMIHEYKYDCIIVSIIHLYNEVLEILMAQGVDIDKVISLGSVV